MGFLRKYRPTTKQELRKLILNEDIELAQINTSKITDMSHLFEPRLETGEQARFFYDGIETWDVSNVTNMSFMFCYAKNFNEDISKWNVGKVTNMRGMFQFASSFNQDISSWDVSKVENMQAMFYDAAAFSYPLDGWNIEKVKNMRFMFMYARYFAKKPTWDMSNVEDDAGMYYGSPIVYVDPNSQVGVDVELEKLAAKECIDRELNSALNQDGIASFAKNVVEKATKLTETLDTKPKVEEKKVEDENIVRLRSLVDKGLLKASEFEILKNLYM